jgi:hypothetical protein
MKKLLINTVGSVSLMVALAWLPGIAHAVDGVILIDQARALAGNVTPGDGPGFPVTISQPGSYRLAGNLTGGGIDVRARDVSIDLNGFTIVASGSIGISNTSGNNLVVKNGTIRGASLGILAHLGNTRIENIFVTQSGGGNPAIILDESGNMILNSNISENPGDAISIFGGDCVIKDTVITLNTGRGIVLGTNPNPPGTPGGGCTITGNTISGNAVGIEAGFIQEIKDGSLILGNTLRHNTGLGLNLNASFPSSVGYSSNVLTGNNGGNQNPQVAGGIPMGSNVCGTALCP